MDNVLIKVFERGKLRETRSGHNVWVDRGNEYLASMIAYASFGPDTPERNERVRYMGVGIGGVEQALLSIANSAPLSTSYPAGSDPHATTGNEYSDTYPIDPLIGTLERPIRVTGGSTAYPGDPGDVWLIDAPNFWSTHASLYELTLHGLLDGPAGDVIYAPFTQMPLSEVGLFTDEAGVDISDPFSPLVAYFSFDTIVMTTDVVLELVWSVKF